jgi:hypothetical protein
VMEALKSELSSVLCSSSDPSHTQPTNKPLPVTTKTLPAYNLEEPRSHGAMWSRPDTKGLKTLSRISASMRPWSDQIRGSRKYITDLQGPGEAKGRRCLMETEFQSGKMKMFWRWMVAGAAQHGERARWHSICTSNGLRWFICIM